MIARTGAAAVLAVGVVFGADYAGRRLDGWPRLAVALVLLAALAVVFRLTAAPKRHR